MAPIVVVYYSRTGKTQMVARKLAKLLDVDLEEITESKDRYGKLGFLAAAKDALTSKPSQLTSQHVTEGRSAVILGMPVWANSPPPAIRAYISAVDLAGKKLAAFCTYDVGGSERAFAKLAKLLPEKLLETLELKKPDPGDAALDDRLQNWARTIKDKLSPAT